MSISKYTIQVNENKKRNDLIFAKPTVIFNSIWKTLFAQALRLMKISLVKNEFTQLLNVYRKETNKLTLPLEGLQHQERKN